MSIEQMHSWDLSPAQARLLQSELASRVRTDVPLPKWRILAAADVSFDRGGTILSAGIVVVHAETFELIERVGVAEPMTFPYVPGLLSFRELPSVLKAFERLTCKPDIILCDGQGIAHPRRLGIASHLGLVVNLPTVGCAKSRLCGTFTEPGLIRGEHSSLIADGKAIGTVLRTRDRVKPLFVSPGHLCDMKSALKLVLDTTTKYRLPIPTRMAHDYVNAIRRAVKAGGPIPD